MSDDIKREVTVDVTYFTGLEEEEDVGHPYFVAHSDDLHFSTEGYNIPELMHNIQECLVLTLRDVDSVSRFGVAPDARVRVLLSLPLEFVPNPPRPESPPLVCDFHALTPEQKQRYAVVTQALNGQRTATPEQPDGYAFVYPNTEDNQLLLLEFIRYERLCCPFFDFELRFSAGSDEVWLHLTGPEGVKELIRAEMGIKND